MISYKSANELSLASSMVGVLLVIAGVAYVASGSVFGIGYCIAAVALMSASVAIDEWVSNTYHEISCVLKCDRVKLR